MTFKRIATTALVATLLAACSSSRAGEKDIVDTAVDAGSFKTLAAALGAADLVDALKGEGPLHRIRPNRRSLRKATKRHGRDFAQT